MTILDALLHHDMATILQDPQRREETFGTTLDITKLYAILVKLHHLDSKQMRAFSPDLDISSLPPVFLERKDISSLVKRLKQELDL